MPLMLSLRPDQGLGAVLLYSFYSKAMPTPFLLVLGACSEQSPLVEAASFLTLSLLAILNKTPVGRGAGPESP